jgi:membrane protein
MYGSVETPLPPLPPGEDPAHPPPHVPGPPPETTAPPLLGQQDRAQPPATARGGPSGARPPFRPHRLLIEAFQEWREDQADRLAAALAYYTVFSLAPMLVVVLAVAGLFFGDEAARGALSRQVEGLIGREGAGVIEEMVAAARRPAEGTMAAVIGLALLLFGASGLFGQLQFSLNTIWDVASKPGRGLWAVIRERFLSFTMVLGVGFLLLVSLVLGAGLAALQEMWGPSSDPALWLWQALHFLLSFGVTTLLFAMIYNILPDVDIAWRDVWIGALTTAVLFTIGKQAIGLYLGHSSVTSAYGAAGSLVVILLWVYYSAMILFFGAELTQVFANRYGAGVNPSRGAIPLPANSKLKRPTPTGAAPRRRPAPAADRPARRFQVPPGLRRTLDLASMALVGLGTLALGWRRSQARWAGPDRE